MRLRARIQQVELIPSNKEGEYVRLHIDIRHQSAERGSFRFSPEDPEALKEIIHEFRLGKWINIETD